MISYIATLLFAPAALAWTWDSIEAPAGDSLTWRICEDTFTFSTAEEDEIGFAAAGWDAGTSEAMRGALWDFTKSTDRASCAIDNGFNEVYERSDSWFSARGIGGAIAVCENDPADNDIDVIFKQTVNWATVVPSNTTGTQVSIGQVALHEFGHALGFNHETTEIATMNGSYPNGGDISAFKYRPNEDDYVGLVANRPHSSTGTNLMLSRWVTGPTEVWDFKSSTRWTVCDTVVASSVDGPEEIFAIIHSTTSATPQIEWRLSTDQTCFSGTEYTIGTRTPGLGSNVPHLVAPTNYDFTGIPAGDYWVCAMIDPSNAIAETATSDADNDLISTVRLTVQDCP
jgi:hypothetical protein